MTVERHAQVTWDHDLLKGSGRFTVGSGALPESPVSWAARTEQPGGKTSPEELLAAAHASCFAMAFASTLSKAGTPPEQLRVVATCSFDKLETGWKVSRMVLEVTGAVPRLEARGFEELARKAEASCPISNALRNNVAIAVRATLA